MILNARKNSEKLNDLIIKKDFTQANIYKFEKFKDMGFQRVNMHCLLVSKTLYNSLCQHMHAAQKIPHSSPSL